MFGSQGLPTQAGNLTAIHMPRPFKPPVMKMEQVLGAGRAWLLQVVRKGSTQSQRSMLSQNTMRMNTTDNLSFLSL